MLIQLVMHVDVIELEEEFVCCNYLFSYAAGDGVGLPQIFIREYDCGLTYTWWVGLSAVGGYYKAARGFNVNPLLVSHAACLVNNKYHLGVAISLPSHALATAGLHGAFRMLLKTLMSKKRVQKFLYVATLEYWINLFLERTIL